jgi:hypothetical protein
MTYYDSLQLSALPLSAYTPGQGDPTMEGGFATASGAPMYTFESYLAGRSPYVTGATSMKNPTGQLIYRRIGDQVVPVRITDYGPAVQGIDIASSNPSWATNFPYQGSTDTGLLAQQQPGAAAAAPAAATGAPAAAAAAPAAAAAATPNKWDTSSTGANVGSIMGMIAQMMGQQQQGQNAALQSFLSRPRPSVNYLAQLAANPTMFLGGY